jgi:hypothetical protein
MRSFLARRAKNFAFTTRSAVPHWGTSSGQAAKSDVAVSPSATTTWTVRPMRRAAIREPESARVRTLRGAARFDTSSVVIVVEVPSPATSQS